MAMRGRQKVSVTLDPGLLGEVDAYVEEHGGDRSHVIDDALRCWIAQRQKLALREQFTAPRSPEEQEELEAWRRIRAAQFPHLLAKYEAHDKE